PHRFEFRAFTPSTCVAWDHAPVRRAALRLLDRTVKQHAPALLPGDTGAWSEVLDVALGVPRQVAAQDVLCACSSSHP
ncbi:MAG TPA: hypothetical protein VJ756_18535, partial [Terriglobales bacterium]|nr:hypothetical protein [Terriglobales bacterium]